MFNRLCENVNLVAFSQVFNQSDRVTLRATRCGQKIPTQDRDSQTLASAQITVEFR